MFLVCFRTPKNSVCALVCVSEKTVDVTFNDDEKEKVNLQTDFCPFCGKKKYRNFTEVHDSESLKSVKMFVDQHL